MIKVVTWRNGNANNSTCYGIKVSKKDFKVIEHWKEIIIDDYIIFRNNSKFTLKCPEIRNKSFKPFFEKNGLLEWQRRKPNVMYLKQYDENKFELLLNTI
jgi:hypothetical protein